MATTTVCAAAAAVPATAGAAPPDHYSVEVDLVNDAECGDMIVHYEGAAHGTFQFKQRRDGVFLGQGIFHERLRATNLVTGRAVDYEVHGVDKDLAVTDNGDGTLTILAAFSGIDRFSGQDGGLVYQAAGTTRRELFIDTMGTQDPDDDVALDEQVVKEAGARNGSAGALRGASRGDRVAPRTWQRIVHRAPASRGAGAAGRRVVQRAGAGAVAASDAAGQVAS